MREIDTKNPTNSDKEQNGSTCPSHNVDTCVHGYVCVYIYNVAAHLVIWASLMRFFPLFKPGPKK